MTDWKLEAKKCLDFITANLKDAHRGAIQYPHNIIIVFSNRRQGEIARLRDKLIRKKVFEKLGFYFNDESWVMLLRAPDDRTKHLNWAMKTIWDCCENPSLHDYDNAGRLICAYLNSSFA